MDSYRIHRDEIGSPLSKFYYDFAEHGGLIGDYELQLELPANAIVTGGFIDTVEIPASAGSATIALNIEGAGDLLAATAIASVTGQVALIPDNTPANMVKTTATRTLTMSVATADLTAGKLYIFLDYVLSE